MRVLVACEFSGIVRDAFLRRDHDAWSCDIMAGIGERHIKGDVSPVLRQEWDLIIAHPPCTYLCNIGWSSIWKKPQKRVERTLRMFEGVEFFLQCLNANAERICVENPIPVGLALNRIGSKYSQIVHPWQYGHPYTKATCLWLKNLPLLQPTNIVEPTAALVTSGRNTDRKLPDIRHKKHIYGIGRLRSIFHIGIAEAMADQWGNL